MQIILCQLPLIKLLRGETQTGFPRPTLCERGCACHMSTVEKARSEASRAQCITNQDTGCSQGKWTTPSLLVLRHCARLTVARTNFSVICLATRFLNPHISEWPTLLAEQVSIHVSHSTPLPLLSVVTKSGQDKKREWRALHLRPEAQGSTYHRQSLCSNVGRETLGTFFFTLLCISDQT